MIWGIGTDLVSIERFVPWLAKPHLISRFFDAQELEACTGSPHAIAASLAARFAAKEAFGKALGTGMRGLKLSDISVRNDALGKPSLCVVGSAEQAIQRSVGVTAHKNTRIHLSLSHDHGCALAFVIVETTDKE